MTGSPDPQNALRTARILAFALGVGAPLCYLGMIVATVLGGRPAHFLAGFAGLPWANPMLAVLLAVSAVNLALAFLLPDRLAARQPGDRFARLRSALILRCALLESVAIFGLVLAFVLGPCAATLALLMALVPIVGTLLNFPKEAEWR